MGGYRASRISTSGCSVIGVVGGECQDGLNEDRCGVSSVSSPADRDLRELRACDVRCIFNTRRLCVRLSFPPRREDDGCSPSQREIRGHPTRPPRPNIDRFGRAGIRRVRLGSGAAVRAAVRWCTTSSSSCVITRPTGKRAQNDRVFLTVVHRDQKAARVAMTTAGRGTITRPALSVLMITR